jgi:hypothetical protein|tara:strand:+ start:7999 stop:8127 length:129 start_codon:yes stop_codon:yes gene_type:complete
MNPTEDFIKAIKEFRRKEAEKQKKEKEDLSILQLKKLMGEDE